MAPPHSLPKLVVARRLAAAIVLAGCVNDDEALDVNLAEAFEPTYDHSRIQDLSEHFSDTPSFCDLVVTEAELIVKVAVPGEGERALELARQHPESRDAGVSAAGVLPCRYPLAQLLGWFDELQRLNPSLVDLRVLRRANRLSAAGPDRLVLGSVPERAVFFTVK